MKILLLEDDQLLNNAINKYLTLKGHAVVSFRDGTSAKNAMLDSDYDLFLLDINVPNESGLSLLEMLNREKIQTPTIFISAIIDIDDISRAFDLGCHDYLKKPFHLKELSIRIDKLLQTNYIPHTHIRLSKNYSLDMETMTLRLNNEVQVLTQKHLEILALLAKNRSRTVDYALFQEQVWDGVDIEIPTIRAEINRLKKILKEDLIVNIRNVGYMIERPD